MPVIITWSIASILFAVIAIGTMSVPNKAWSIDDVVQDVYHERLCADGSVERILTTEALVHIGPYADVRYFISTVPDCSVCTHPSQIVSHRRERVSITATRILRVDLSEGSPRSNVLCLDKTHARFHKVL